MKNVFAPTEFGVECDRGRIDVVGLHVDDVSAALEGDFLELGDQCGGDALPPMRFIDCEIIDVDFAALLFELDELVSGETRRRLDPFSTRPAR